ncbi:helix-turn-helix transcriptional regulator, partial [Solirubrobacter phytolaccae]
GRADATPGDAAADIGARPGRADAADAEARKLALAYLAQRAYVLYFGVTQPGALRALLERAAGWWPDAAWRLQLDVVRMQLATHTGEFAAALERSAAALADPALDCGTRRHLEPLHAANLFFAGRCVESVERSSRPEVPLRGVADQIAFAVWLGNRLQTGVGWDELHAVLPGALADAVRAGDHGGAGLAALGLGTLAFAEGRLLDAERWLDESDFQLERRDAMHVLPITLALRAGVEVLLGHPDRAGEVRERLRGRLAVRPPLPTHGPYVEHAEAALSSDRAAAARALLAAADEHAGMAPLAAQLAYQALLLGASPARVAARLRGAATGSPAAGVASRPHADTGSAHAASAAPGPLAPTGLDSPLVAAYRLHADGLVAHDGQRLLQAADAFEAIGAAYFAQLASVDAARAFVAAGREDSARRAAARARSLHVPDQGGAAPLVDGLGGVAVQLTAREAQLSELAARGLSNAQIAERLVLSVRTVESHVYRAMQKLGVNDRHDLPLR